MTVQFSDILILEHDTNLWCTLECFMSSTLSCYYVLACALKHFTNNVTSDLNKHTAVKGSNFFNNKKIYSNNNKYFSSNK